MSTWPVILLPRITCVGGGTPEPDWVLPPAYSAFQTYDRGLKGSLPGLRLPQLISQEGDCYREQKGTEVPGGVPCTPGAQGSRRQSLGGGGRAQDACWVLDVVLCSAVCSSILGRARCSGALAGVCVCGGEWAGGGGVLRGGAERWRPHFEGCGSWPWPCGLWDLGSPACSLIPLIK